MITSDTQKLLSIYRAAITAREIDRVEADAVRRGLAFFHVSGAGHESSAALAGHLTPADWLNCHYRDKALMIARGLEPRDFFNSLYCNAASQSQGRQVSALMCAPALKISSITGPVGNSALHAVGMALANRDMGIPGIAVVSCGDGTTQEGEYLEALAEAKRWSAPVLFLIHDNQLAISTVTAGKTFFSCSSLKDSFHGIPIHFLNGADVAGCDEGLGQIVMSVRQKQSPVIAVLRLERLDSHTNADDHTIYRKSSAIEAGRVNWDPIANLEVSLCNGGTSVEVIRSIRDEVRATVAEHEQLSWDEPISQAKLAAFTIPSDEQRTILRNTNDSIGLTMGESIRESLRIQLRHDERVLLYGQDIEDPKGDVFGVTRGLSTEFSGRVINAPLSESTILGTSIGRALAGQRPVAMIQFADFLPLAFNQIINELATMDWRTNGGLRCPVLVMAPCGGYRPGLGPSHAASMESLLCHVPGLDVVMPSTADAAAGLINAAFASVNPTVFLYPKAVINDGQKTSSKPIHELIVSRGQSRLVRSGGKHLTIVAWGNTVALCERAVETLERNGFAIDLIDLCWLAPWDVTAVVDSSRKTGRLLVVHEDNLTGGFGAEIVATVAQKLRSGLQVARVARPDVFVPCRFENQLEILPSYEDVMTAAADLLELGLVWPKPLEAAAGIHPVNVIGSAPSDETVLVVEVNCTVGDQVKCGDMIAELEASKSVVEIEAPVTGVVDSISVHEGDTVSVGTPLLFLRTTETVRTSPPTRPVVMEPRISRKRKHVSPQGTKKHDTARNVMRTTKFISRSKSVVGGQSVSTEQVCRNVSDWTSADAIARTGIESRFWATAEESVVSLATTAAKELLLSLDGMPEISAVICSTTSPSLATPSVSCQVATNIADLLPHRDWHAFDVNAACSGFMFGLRFAFDQLMIAPETSVLLLTSEVLSPMINPSDPATAFLFGDAATATLVSSQPTGVDSLKIHRPILRSTADPDRLLTGPCVGSGGYLKMEGIATARTANKEMARVMNEAAEFYSVNLGDLKQLIPHPGSQRILSSVARRLDLNEEAIVHTLRETGNTSSSSIPLTLDREWGQIESKVPLGLFAFGAGFTSAATIATKQ